MNQDRENQRLWREEDQRMRSAKRKELFWSEIEEARDAVLAKIPKMIQSIRTRHQVESATEYLARAQQQFEFDHDVYQAFARSLEQKAEELRDD